MKGKAIIFCAPSGAGKTTIVRHLLSKISKLEFSISATTRKPRSAEIDGSDYHFLLKKDFLDKVDSNEVLEWQEVYENSFYGTLRSEVEKIWEKGNHVIFDVDVKGGIELKRKLGDSALSIFIKVENLEVLRNRLKERNTESEHTLEKRILKASDEMKDENKFDVVIVNNDLEDALVLAERTVTQFLG